MEDFHALEGLGFRASHARASDIPTRWMARGACQCYADLCLLRLTSMSHIIPPMVDRPVTSHSNPSS
eukprot:1264199-Amphidinium_carterae.1